MTLEEPPVSRRRFREQRARERGRRAGWALIAVGIPMIVVGGIFLFGTPPTGEPLPDVRGTSVVRTSTTVAVTRSTRSPDSTEASPAPTTSTTPAPTGAVTGGPRTSAP